MVNQEPQEGTAHLGSLKVFDERPGQGSVTRVC